MTEAEVAAIEKATERFNERLKKAGLLESFGDVERDDEKDTSLRGMVQKAVVEHLGHEPISKAEEVRVRKQIYDAHPGLAAACRAEEKADKVAGVAAA